MIENHNKDRVSICIPVYNCENTVRDCILSALNQSYKDIEVVIVDNASTDGTWELINSIEDCRLKGFRNEENIGAAANWNAALQKANYTLTLLLHSDDILVNDFVEFAVTAYRKYERRVPIIVGQSVHTSSLGRKRCHPAKLSEGKYEKGAEALITILKNIPHPCTYMVEKECYESVGYYNTGRYRENMAEEIFPRLFSKYDFIFIKRSAVKIGGGGDQIGNISWTREHFIHRYAEIKFQHISQCDLDIHEKAQYFRDKLASVCYSIAYPTAQRGYRKLAMKYLHNAVKMRPAYLIRPRIAIKALLCVLGIGSRD